MKKPHEANSSVERKAYHPPQLKEYGDLRDHTLADAGGGEFDGVGYGNAAS